MEPGRIPSYVSRGATEAQLIVRRTLDWKVAGSIPGSEVHLEL